MSAFKCELCGSTELKSGAVIKFGNYHGATNWRVLAVEGSKALVISQQCLDRQPYGKDNSDTTWEKSYIRKWLNSDFIKEAFSKEEQGKIVESDVSADRVPVHASLPGNPTKDKVFLLSYPEVEKYLPTEYLRRCKPTAYAVEKGTTMDGFESSWWWLRSPGLFQNYAGRVYFGGKTGVEYSTYAHSYSGVRPAMWINLD